MASPSAHGNHSNLNSITCSLHDRSTKKCWCTVVARLSQADGLAALRGPRRAQRRSSCDGVGSLGQGAQWSPIPQHPLPPFRLPNGAQRTQVWCVQVQSSPCRSTSANTRDPHAPHSLLVTITSLEPMVSGLDCVRRGEHRTCPISSRGPTGEGWRGQSSIHRIESSLRFCLAEC